MAHDYTKPGKTPPGTVHPRPEPRERRTWYDVIHPAADNVAKPAVSTPTTALFTRMVDGKLVTRDEPFADVAAGARKSRRLAVARRERQRRKGQRAFTRQQLMAERERDTMAALIRVARGESQATPAARANVLKNLQRRMEALQS